MRVSRLRKIPPPPSLRCSSVYAPFTLHRPFLPPMKTPHRFVQRVIVASLASVAVSQAVLWAAQAERPAATFDLPRVKKDGAGGGDDFVARGKATVHELSANGRATSRPGADPKVNFLAIDGGTGWSSSIRGGAKDTTFVSFFLLVSAGTAIDVAGAKILVRAGTAPNTVQMQIGRPGKTGMQWRNFGGPVRTERYGRAALAALPVLTLRLDGSAGIWDLFVGGRLGAADLPLRALPAEATREFHIHAGADGARVCGLISSDDNPLFADENHNGIEDGFERQRNNGVLLTQPGRARTQLAQSSQQDQQARRVATQPWSVRRPQPDGKPVNPPRR